MAPNTTIRKAPKVKLPDDTVVVHLPLEIKQLIASHLDRQTAFALTLTCKGLRDAGETKLYKEVDLTSGETVSQSREYYTLSALIQKSKD